MIVVKATRAAKPHPISCAILWSGVMSVSFVSLSVIVWQLSPLLDQALCLALLRIA